MTEEFISLTLVDVAALEVTIRIVDRQVQLNDAVTPVVGSDGVDVDAAWQRFNQKLQPKQQRYGWMKIAASFIGVLLVSGITFAAIHIVRTVSNPQPQPTQAEQTISAKPAPALPTDTIKTDTVSNVQPIVFDNITLDKMLPQIAAYYNKEVEFQNTDARQFRFYFVWKQEETLEAVLHRLNLFESITVELKDNKIIIE